MPVLRLNTNGQSRKLLSGFLSFPHTYCGLPLPSEKDINKSLADYSVPQPMY
jgi:transcriptional regulator of met regulon